MNQNDLRIRVRILKATKNISYKALAEHLELSGSSMYNWLHSQYDFSEERVKMLESIIDYLEG